MTNVEVRNSKEYINAYAEYLKTEDDAECRKLLTENATDGTIPVPEFVYDIVKHAWDREGIFRRVKKSYLKGNLKVGFEISGDDAKLHTEGGDPISEEALVTGTVELVPQTIKKYVSLSDEILDTANGEQFLKYVYEELTYRIAKKAADVLIGKIKSASTASTSTAVGVPAIVASAVSQGLVAQAIGNLSDEAANPVIMMNKLTWASFKAAQYEGNFSADIFEGLPVEFNDKIAAVSAASTGDTWLIIGDLEQGALANLPAGNDIKFKFDDLTLATSDLIKVIGRMPVAIDLIAPKHFVKVTK